MSVRSPRVVDVTRQLPDLAPGCYRNLPPRLGESFNGFLLRLAEANRYAGIADFGASALHIDRARAARNLGRLAIEIRSNRELLGLLGRVAVGDARSTERFAVELLPDEDLFIDDCRVDRDAWLETRAQVCPQCLSNEGFAREAWDLAPVTVCPEHRCRLIDECRACRQPFAWSRASLLRCEHCGSDLRLMRCEAASELDCRVAADFSALAPFRLALQDGSVISGKWESAFKIVKALTLDLSHFVTGEWPAQAHFSRLSAERRFDALRRFGTCSTSNSYAPSELSSELLAPLAALKAIPRPELAGRTVFRMLFSGAGMPREVAAALTSDFAAAPRASGVRLFGGRPPRLASRSDVEAFLGVDGSTFERLRRLGLIRPRAHDDLGYDIDDVLDCQAYLAQQLLTVVELERVLGVTLDLEDLSHSSLLARWNPASATDLRVAVDAVASVQLQLAARCDAATAPEVPTAFGALATRGERTFQLLCQLVSAAVAGDFTRLKWGPPFTWACVMADEREAQRLLLMRPSSYSAASFSMGVTNNEAS